MLETPDLRFFSVVAAASTLAAAARELNVTPPAVSQRLAQIEERLGLRLIERGRGNLVLTADGDRLLRRAEAILDDLSILNDDLVASRCEVAGPVRTIAPFGFGRVHLAPVIGEIVQEHPGISPDLVLSDDPYGAAAFDNWDLIVHIGQIADSAIVQRKLARNRRFLCATPKYLAEKGEPKHPSELREHACGVIREDQADVAMWSFTDADKASHSVRIHPAFASNNGEVVKTWALQDLGIVLRSEWDVARDLRNGRMRRVLVDFSLPDADIVVLLSPRTLRTARVECVAQKLTDSISKLDWQELDLGSE